MRFIVLFLFYCFPAFASENIEVLGGGLTYHVLDFGTSYAYSNKLSQDGRLIYNATEGIGYISESGVFYQGYYLFVGNNSIAAPIYGGLWKNGLVFDRLYIGYTIGAYIQDNNAFKDIYITPFQLTEVGTTGIVPLIGVNIDYKLPLCGKSYLKLNNFLSPVIIIETISLGFEI